MHGHYTPPPPPSRSPRRSSGMRVNVGMRDVSYVYLGGNITRSDWRRSVVTGLGAMVWPQPTCYRQLAVAGGEKHRVINRFCLCWPLLNLRRSQRRCGMDRSERRSWHRVGLRRAPAAPQRGPRVSSDPAAPYNMQGGGRARELSEPDRQFSGGLVAPGPLRSPGGNRFVVEALRQTDLYFAWLDTPMCAFTLTEIGWAQ